MSIVTTVINRCLSYEDETEWFEYKDNLFKPDDIGEYISALSNGAAMAGEPYGYLIWGIHNKTHEFTDTKFNFQKDIDNEPFQHYLSRYVSPSFYFHFDEDIMSGKRVVLLTIPAARIVPTSYKEERYIRIGSSKEKLKKYPDREMALFKLLIERENPMDDWEVQVSKYRIDDIDRDVFEEYLRNAHEAGRITFKSNTPKVVMNKLELAEGEHLLNAGAVLFVDCGLNELQMAKFASDERITITDMKRHTGSVFDLADKAVSYINDAMDWRPEFDGSIKRKEHPEVPVKAIREAVINAFGHRLIESRQAVEVAIYKSFIDIYSPGSFPENVTPEQFIFEELKPIRRNPLIARTLYYSKDMESFATGLRRIYDACTEAKVKVEFIREPYGFTVRFHRHCGEEWDDKNNQYKSQAESQAVFEKHPNKHPDKTKSEEIRSRAETIKELLRQKPSASRSEIAKVLSLTETQVRTGMDFLKNNGEIHREGPAFGGMWIVDE